MKKIITLLSFTTICVTQTTVAQTKQNGEITLTAEKVVCDKGPKFICKQITYNDQIQVMTLMENVSLTTDKFKLDNADKVIYNEKNKKLTIYGCKSFTIQGKIILKDNPTQIKTIEYTLGDDTVYIL